MTSSIHRFVTRLSKSNVFGRAVEHLPEEVRDALENALQYFALDEKPTLIRRGPLCEGGTAQGVAVFLGQVQQGATLRGANLMKGTITGGSLRSWPGSVSDGWGEDRVLPGPDVVHALMRSLTPAVL